MLCGGESSAAFVARDRNREVSGARFAYRRCDACATVFLPEPPDDLGRYYGRDYYDFSDDGMPRWRASDFLRGVETFRVDLLREYVQPGVLIEIGAGAGAFSAAAHDAGFDVTAIEMDARCCEHLRDGVGIAAIQSDRPAEALGYLPAATVVAMWHVLEHVPNPGELLAAVADHVEPGGILALGIPNPESLQFRLLGTRWAHLDAPRHLSLVPAPAVIRWAQALGFTPVELMTDDPFGRHLNQHGWTAALSRRPARGFSRFADYGGFGLTKLLRPLERRGRRGAGILMLLRKDAGTRPVRLPSS